MAKYKNLLSGVVGEVPEHIAALPDVSAILEPVDVEGCLECDLPVNVTPASDDASDHGVKNTTGTKKESRK